MKVLFSLVWLFITVIGISAQTANYPSDTPKVSIIEKKWRLEIRNPALDEDPFRANNEQRQAETDRRENIRQNEQRAALGRSQEVAPVRGRTSQPAVSRNSTKYVYELKIKNDSEKAIKSIVWEYVFYELGTQTVVGQRQFASKSNIAPGKTKNLVVRSGVSPADTVDAAKPVGKSREQYSEQIIIQSIEYEDGSFWKLPSN